jgi:proline iminopeptidase
MRRFCNPEKFLIVLHDQRGAGKSKPYAEIQENTTQNLVDDIEKLRKNLELDQIILFGGSWGSTLALAYAETYPENVRAMILRGIFTATKDEIDYFYHGGTLTFFPDTYDKLTSALPEPDRRPLPEYLFSLIQSNDPGARDKYSMAWARYEVKMSVLEISDERIDEIFSRHSPYAFALLENYYMANGCFLEEGQLLRDAENIRDIPAILVNGRYDAICPPINAYRLHQKLPNSKLVIVEGAGHWMGEKPIERVLLKAFKEVE